MSRANSNITVRHPADTAAHPTDLPSSARAEPRRGRTCLPTPDNPGDPLILISHNHAEGTLVSGTHRSDRVLDLIGAYGFRSHPDVGIYLRGSRDKPARRDTIDAAAAALREHGHTVTVDIDDQWRPAAEREADRGQRADERAERLTDRATTVAARGDARRQAAEATTAGIPTGQPMMPGHHSYRSDRDRRERAHQHRQAANREHDTAVALSQRAAGVQAAEAAKDDPRAIMRRIDRLRADLRRWEREREEAVQVDAASSYQTRVHNEIARLEEDIAHQEAKLADRAASGQFVAWGPDNLAKNDWVRVGMHGWYRVTRVNRKTVSLDNRIWPQKAPYDKIYGRRRGGAQLDAPNGRPWPVEQAKAVARWQHLAAAARSSGYDPAPQEQARHVGYAQRLVHGLPLTADDRQVTAFWPTADTDADARRRLAMSYLTVYDRLAAGEPVPDIAASLAVDAQQPTWRMPDGQPVDRLPADVRPGDIIAGTWDTGYNGRQLHTGFTGPVAAVEHRPADGERRAQITITLTDGTSHDFKTSRWLSVHPANT
ncbi:DUF3560 domain-containing protein [Catellatospora sp. TT07R-123]|uniref:DUF3560 domain-containing protein n=1 Tax=Catellatospora sp. TT07R-123 TaxID=2733863 RepID=UPI0035B554E6